MTKTVEKRPVVSVIVTTHNRATFLRRAMSSVLAQSFRDFELIVVDDASTDHTQKVVHTFADGRIRFVRHEKNRGAGAARNTGIRMARGSYVALLDSDDEWRQEKLKKQVDYFKDLSRDVGVLYCKYLLKNDSNGCIYRVRNSRLRKGRIQDALLRGWCPAIGSSVLLRREVFEKYGLFDETLPSYQDYDFWLKISGDCAFEYVPEHLVIVHSHSGDQVARDPDARIHGLDLFLKKWASAMEEAGGEQAVKGFLKKHLSMIYQNVLFGHFSAMTWPMRRRYLKKLKRVDAFDSITVFKVILMWAGGPGLLGFAARFRNRLFLRLFHRLQDFPV